MLIRFVSGVFVADATYAEKDAVKQAGFWWHGGGCRSTCAACAAGLPLRVWWSSKTEAAARLAAYADDSAKSALASHVATVEASKAVDASPDVEIPAPDGLSYLPYQRGGIAYAMARPRVLIGDEMGLGKTIQGLGIVNADATIKSVLVVCPASLRINWHREASKWLTRSFTFHIVDGNAAPPADASFVIVPYSRIVGKHGSEVLPALMTRKWDMLIVDEAHFLKNPKSKRTVAVLGAEAKRAKGSTPAADATPGLIDQSGRAALLTGTPIPNRPIEMFPLLKALDPRTFGNFFAFAKRYCDARQKPAGRSMVWDFSGASHLDELQEKLRATVMVRRLKKDVLTDLPPKRRQIVTLSLNGAADAVARESAIWAEHEANLERLRDEADLAHAAGDMDGYERAAGDLTKAKGIAFTAISAARKATAIAKLPSVIEHIEGMLEEGVEKLIVFGHHHEVIKKLSAHFGDTAVQLYGETAMADRQSAVDRFQTDPTCKLFIGSIGAAGVGLTLTAASHVVFAELDWVPGNVSQAEDRAHRIGQRDTVFVQHLVLDRSLDARMVEIIIQKQEIADRALDRDAPEIKVPALPSDSGTPRPPKYQPASPELRAAVTEGIRFLALRCDGVRSEDGMGFSQRTAHAGHRLARLARPFTDGEVWYAVKICTIHRRQLPSPITSAIGIK